MANRLNMAKKQQIQVLTNLGWPDRAISRETGIDRGTIAKYRKEFQNQPKVPPDVLISKDENQPEVPTDLPSIPSTNSAQIRPYTETIRNLLIQKLSAQRIYQDLVEEHGYMGSYDSVKRYVRKFRKRVQKFTDRLEHLPGREAQVDFGKATCRVLVNGKWQRPWIFKMTLSCSKHAYEEIVLKQNVETFIRCHERAFSFFGGVPEIITLDNLKSGVITASIFDPILNETYLSFSSHWNFAANPCIPRKPQHKGIVERDVGYTKHNALEGKQFNSISEGNEYLRHWNKRWARTRIHGTTRCQVWKLFCDVERDRLRPCAQTPFEYFTICTRKVDVSGLVEVKRGFYRVPPRLIGEKVVVHYNQQYVKIYSDGKFIVGHLRLKRQGTVSESVDCLPSWKHPDLESQERYYCRTARDISPGLHKLVYEILCSEDPLAIRRVRGILSLAKKFSQDVVDEAANAALGSSTIRYDQFKVLCERYSRNIHTRKESILTQEHELIRSLKDYELAIAERIE